MEEGQPGSLGGMVKAARLLLAVQALAVATLLVGAGAKASDSNLSTDIYEDEANIHKPRPFKASRCARS